MYSHSLMHLFYVVQMAYKSAERSDCMLIMSLIDGSVYPASVKIFRWLVQGGTCFCHIASACNIIGSSA